MNNLVSLSELDTLVKAGLVGSSSAMQNVIKEIKQAAKFPEFPVMFVGETGTGKELAAQMLHRSTRYAGRSIPPLVNVNCGAIPDSIFESEMFGHKKGSFTGAVEHRVGLLQHADKGALFLDEVVELSPAAQVKLLRFLEDGMVRSIGTNTEQHSKVRIMAASNTNLKRLVEEKKFREDLYYRLNVICIQMPSLRDRPEDLRELVMCCVMQYNRDSGSHLEPAVDEFVIEELARQPWRGNVRELFHAVQQAIIRSDGLRLQAKNFVFRKDEPESMGPDFRRMSLDQFEGWQIREALKISEGNQTQAAHYLGVDFRCFRYRVKKHKVNVQSFSPLE